MDLDLDFFVGEEDGEEEEGLVEVKRFGRDTMKNDGVGGFGRIHWSGADSQVSQRQQSRTFYCFNNAQYTPTWNLCRVRSVGMVRPDKDCSFALLVLVGPEDRQCFWENGIDRSR